MKTEGELWGAFPGVQMHEHTDTWNGEFESCVDIDVPLNAEWSDVSDLRGAVDLLEATISLLDSDKNAGGDATIRVRERTTAEFVEADPSVVTGIWSHELKTWFRAGILGIVKDWATRVTDARMSVGFLDPDNLKLEVLPHDAIGVQDDLASGWSATGVSGNRFYGSVLLQALFHPTVEAEAAKDKGIQEWVDAWAGEEGLWQTIDDRTGQIIDWSLPELAPGTEVVDGKFAHQTHHECRAEEKKAEHDAFEPLATTPDGSTFEFAVRWDNQRVQLYLIGKYANDEVRFVRELYDFDPGPKACMLELAGNIDIDELTGRTEVDIAVDVTANATPAAEDWTNAFDWTFVFDASGNGWVDESTRNELVAAGAVAGEPVTFTGGMESQFGNCVWYPGDGARITPGDPDMDPLARSATHTYAFPGTYHVMQLCSFALGEVDGHALDPFSAWVREGTITVTDPG